MTYKPISTSVYVQCSRYKDIQGKDERCYCHRVRELRDYCTDNCINRTSKIECDDDNCLCQDYCRNRYFGKGNTRKLEIVQTACKGEGLVTLQPIAKGAFVIEYIGQIYDLTTEYGAKRYQSNQKDKLFYMMEIKKGVVVDASKQGNISRFINHSCQPNCKVEKWLVKGQSRLGIFALRNISQFEELSYNYRESFWQQNNFTCRCGTPSCIFKEIPPSEITLIVKLKIGHLMYLRTNYSKYIKQPPCSITWDKKLVQQNSSNLNFVIDVKLYGQKDKVHSDRNILIRLSKIQCVSYYVDWQSIQKIEYYLNKSQIFFSRISSENVNMAQIFIMGLPSELKPIKYFLSTFKKIILSQISDPQVPSNLKISQESQTDQISVNNSQASDKTPLFI